MITVAQDILPYRLKRVKWESAHNYVLDIHQDKTVGGEQQSLQCRLPLRLTMTNFNSKSAVIWLQTGRPTFNDSRDYDKLQWVFARLMSINDKVGIRTRTDGSIWQIINEKQIRSRWPAVKKQILEMYDDPVVDELIRRHEMNLANHFESIYSREPMMQLLFNDLFRDYEDEDSAETPKVWPRHLGDIAFPIIERKQLTALRPRRNEAVIEIYGTPDMERIDHQAVNSYLGQAVPEATADPYQFGYKGRYQMDTKRGCMRETTLKVEGALGDNYRKRTNYHLKATDHE